MGDRFEGVSGLAPGAQSADDDESFESLFLQQVRHPGACGLALSSTVEINLPIARQGFDLRFEIIGLKANRSRDAF